MGIGIRPGTKLGPSRPGTSNLESGSRASKTSTLFLAGTGRIGWMDELESGELVDQQAYALTAKIR